jgi:hypothetical protein
MARPVLTSRPPTKGRESIIVQQPRVPDFGLQVRINFLHDLKAVAERAKMKKEDFWLHKFGATFATRRLGTGIGLRAV